MTCKDANKIPLAAVLNVLNCKALKQHTQKKETWYQNPIRSETQSSFSVNSIKNTWYDFGDGIGGTVLDLVMKRFQKDVKEALDWLGNNMNSQSIEYAHTAETIVYEKPVRYVFKSEQEIYNYALKSYLKARKIDVEIAKKFVKEIRFLDTVSNKTFFSLGVKNLKQGYSLRNSFGKTILGFSGLTYYKSNSLTDTVLVFEGLFDFLSYLMITSSKELTHDVILLNSIALAKRGIDFIDSLDDISNIILFLDNPKMDNEKSKENIARAISLFIKDDYKVFSANENFKNYSDLAEYWEAETSQKELAFSPLN